MQLGMMISDLMVLVGAATNPHRYLLICSDTFLLQIFPKVVSFFKMDDVTVPSFPPTLRDGCQSNEEEGD